MNSRHVLSLLPAAVLACALLGATIQAVYGQTDVTAQAIRAISESPLAFEASRK